MRGSLIMLQNQNGNTVGGSIAGRDVNNYFNGPAKTYIGQLYDRFRQETQQPGQEIDGFFEDLQHFFDKPAKEIERTLADKLNCSNRSDLVDYAEDLKEKAMKKIMRFQSSPSAQEIFAYVLGELRAKYLLHVRPLISSGASRAEVDAAIESNVVQPVAAHMEPSILAIDPNLVLAMYFFLAGNCHIKWD